MNGINEFFEDQGYNEVFLKKNVRVLFDYATDRHFLNDIIVAEFIEPTDNMHLYNQYSSDIGNCISGWDKWTLAQVLLRVFDKEMSHETKRKAFYELAKVKEWRPELALWIIQNYP